MHCLELVYSKNICFESIQNCSKSNCAAGLNRGLLSNICWLRIASHVKFTEECMMCMERHVLVK